MSYVLITEVFITALSIHSFSFCEQTVPNSKKSKCSWAELKFWKKGRKEGRKEEEEDAEKAIDKEELKADKERRMNDTSLCLLAHLFLLHLLLRLLVWYVRTYMCL